MSILNPSTHSISLEDVLKGRAKVIAELIKLEFGHDVSHGQCLKIVSQLFGFKNWNTAKALLPKELLLDPIGMAELIRSRDEHFAQEKAKSKDMESDSEGASESKNSIPAAPVATVGDLRRVLEPYADSTRIEANHIFKLGDFLKGVDYWSSSDDEIEREFSLGFRKADQHDEKQSWVTLELTPTYETITRADSLEGEGREL